MNKKKAIYFCPKCGNMLHGTENFCGHCGYGLHQSNPYYVNSSQKESFNSIWIIVCLLIVIVIGVLFLSPEKFTNNIKTFNSISRMKNIQVTQGEIQSIKDVNEMCKAIDNTIWTYTKPGDLFWLKLEFKDNKVKIYRAFPSDGHWTLEEECPYTLEDGRFIDDGRRYIAAVIKCKDFNTSPKFVITNGHLSWFGFIDTGGFVLGDYEWD